MCFDWGAILTIIIWVIVICAVAKILGLLLPFIFNAAGFAEATALLNLLIAIFRIIFWAALCIALVIIVGEALGCLIGMAGHLRLR